MAKVRVIDSGGVRQRVPGKRRGNRAEDVVETAALDIETGHGPAALAGEPDDRVGNRLPVPGENAKARLAGARGYLDRSGAGPRPRRAVAGGYAARSAAGPLAQLGGNRRGIAGSEIEAHGVVVARAGGELGRRT